MFNMCLKIKYILLLTSVFILSACQTNYFDDFYNDEEQDISSYIPLERGKGVKVIDTFNLEDMLKKYEKDYIILGSSSFSGHWCSRSLAVETAKDKGASLVIIGIEPIGQSTETYAVAVPQANTVYHQGSISGNNYSSGNVYANNGNWGHYNSSTYTSASYTGTSTYYTTQTFYNQKDNYYFNQYAFFMAKKKK